MSSRIERWMATSAEVVVSYSSGKDSTACYLRELERGRPFRAVMWDTGNEHELALEYARTLHDKTGGPPVEIYKADFPEERFARRRAWIAENWPEHGIPQEVIDRAVRCMVRTGIPFLDLCMLKGRFPSRRAQFCTQELKVIPMESRILIPEAQRLCELGRTLVSVIGVRADESRARRAARAWEWGDWGVVKHRPIVTWTAERVFAMHRRHNLAPNPLYSLGCNRVGCMVCVNVSKDELANAAARWPEHIERLREWEIVVATVSKRGEGTFLPAPDKSVLSGIRSIHQHVEWARTSHGGRQFDLETLLPPLACQSNYGLCE